MKNSILKFALLLFTFILTIGCSVDKENSVEEQLTASYLLDDQIIQCIDPNLDTEGYGINIIFVEYEPGLTRAEKQAIRAPYCGSMISIELCDINPNGELWTVVGPCQTSGPNPIVCQPGMIPPSDPDLRQSLQTSECQYPDVGIFTNPFKQQ